MNRIRKPVTALLVALPLVLTGCSGDEGDVDVNAPNVEATPGDVDVDAPDVDAPDAPDVDVDADVEETEDGDSEASDDESPAS